MQMKKILFIISFFLLILSANAQRNSNLTWFTLSLKGGYGTSLMFNQPSFDDANITYAYYSPSYFYGGRFGILFTDNVGVSFVAGMNNLSQTYDVNGFVDYQTNIKLKSFDYGFMLDLQSPTGFYFDIGPKFATLKNADLTKTTEGLSVTDDRIAKFRSQFTSLAFDIGLKALMTDLFEIKVGVSGAYTFSNVVNSTGYIIPADNYLYYVPTYLDETTNPIQLMFGVEFTYVFGKFGKASCGKYRFMLNQ